MLRVDECLHEPERDTNSALLHAHIVVPPTSCSPSRVALPPAERARCLLHAGRANWTATAEGLRDDEPECGRTWMAAGCARKLLAGRDLLFIGNSVIRRQMYTVLDILAGPMARRLVHAGKRKGVREVVPFALAEADSGTLDDPALLTQEGVLNPRVEQASGGGPWSQASIRTTRMWDRDGEPNAYHAAQLVTMDLETGEHRFHRPHQLCGVGDAFMKFSVGRMQQWRAPGKPGGANGAISEGWRRSKWAGREWRPMVSMRWHHEHEPSHASCAASSRFLVGSAPASVLSAHLHRGEATEVLTGLRATVTREVAALLGGQHAPRLDETLAGLTIHIERPMQPTGPNVWILFPTYHGERENFNGFCEDRPGCNCTGVVGPCTAKLCRGKRLCAPLPKTSDAFVEHARTVAAALLAKRTLGGKVLEQPRVSVFYDDCWSGRGRCQGRRPCMEPGDQMLLCRATAMMCPAAPWVDVLARAKAWIPKGHAHASALYLYDGPSQDLFDETFRTWGASTVGHGAQMIVFGPQFASAKPRLLNQSLALITDAVRRADACTRPAGDERTHLIFRSPAYNIDPVNSFRQQRTFAKRVRPLVESLGVTFVDHYTATRDAVLQPTPHAIRFDHFSTFHFHDAGRYIQAQLLLHALRVLLRGG